MTVSTPPESPTAAQTPFYVTGGTLSADATSYVERQADRDLLAGLLNGDYCYVLNSRQMGKSSLCVRTMERLKSQGWRTCFLDLTKFGGRNLSPDQWYAALLSEAGRELGLRSEMLAFWKQNTELGPMQRFFGALQTVALPASLAPLAVFVDEIDVTRGLPFSADEFFAGVRQSYVGRATDNDLVRLTFCLLGTATPADLIQDTRTGPFNIGRRIEVRDFTAEEAAPLAAGLGAGGAALLSRVLYWTGGHPYLTQRLCRASQESEAKDSAAIDTLCAGLFLTRTAAEADDNLAFVRNRLLKSEVDLAGLLDLYGQMRRGCRVPDDEADPLCAVLKLSGVARTEGGALHVRNRIYEHVFSREWIVEHTPGAELRRQREAYRRGLLRAGAAAACVLLVVSLLALSSYQNARRANAKTNEANRNAADRTTAQQQAELSAKQSAALATINAKLADQRAAALTDANQQKKVAQASAHTAQQQQRNAQEAAAESRRQKQIAQKNLGDAQVQTHKAALAEGVAVRQEVLARARLSRAYVETASRLMDSGDYGAALAPLVEAMRLDVGDPARQAQHRRRIASALALVPRLSRVWFGGGPLRWASLSPDGTRAAAAGEDGHAHVWKLATGGELPLRIAHRGPITDAAFSPDGRRLATCGLDGYARLWDLTTCRLLCKLRPANPPEGRLEEAHVSWSQDGHRLATTFDGTATLWKVAQADSAAITPHVIMSSSSAPAVRYTQAAISPDGKILALLARNFVGRQIPIASGNGDVIGSPMFGTCYVGWHVAYSRDAQRLLVAGVFGGSGENIGALVSDASLTPTGLTPRMFRHRQLTRYAVFSPNERMIATACDDGTARVWDASTGQAITPPLRHERPVVHIEFSPNGRRVVTASDDGTARVWDAHTGQPVCAPLHHAGGLVTAQFTADSAHVFTAGQDGTARLWTLCSPTPKPDLSLNTVSIVPDENVRVVAGGTRLAVLTERLRAYNLGPSSLGSRVPSDWVKWMYPDPDGKRFMLEGNGHSKPFRVWDTLREKPLSPLPHADQAWLSPDGDAVLLRDNVGKLRLVASTTGRPLLPPQRCAPGNIATSPPLIMAPFTPNGRGFLILDDSRSVRLLDRRTGRSLTRTMRTPAPVKEWAFSPDGRYLFILMTGNGMGGGEVQVWNIGTGTLASAPGAQGIGFSRGTPLNCQLQFSPDGKCAINQAYSCAWLWRLGGAARARAS